VSSCPIVTWRRAGELRGGVAGGEMGKQIDMALRAQAIAAGLVRTGRAARCRAAAGFIRADRVGAIYWISRDGARRADLG
jgi:hypothetical protein